MSGAQWSWAAKESRTGTSCQSRTERLKDEPRNDKERQNENIDLRLEGKTLVLKGECRRSI